jgi:hypothetical protein
MTAGLKTYQAEVILAVLQRHHVLFHANVLDQLVLLKTKVEHEQFVFQRDL